MMRNTSENLTRAVAFLLMFWMIAGCVTTEKETRQPSETDALGLPSGQVGPGAPGSEPGPEIGYYMHTVKWPGESISIIAKWYTGELDNWKILAEANPDINPNRIFVGNKIRIPVHLMKTQESMPEEFLSQFYPEQPEEEEEPMLFGPKTGN